MNFTTNYKEKKLSKVELAAFEQTNNVQLPEDYKTFILSNNGGTPPDDKSYIIWVDNDNDEVDLNIARFHPIKHGVYTIEDALFSLVQKEIIPNCFLPFGSNGGDAEFCMSLREEDYGAIYYMTLDVEVLYPIKLAANFTEFIANLE